MNRLLAHLGLTAGLGFLVCRKINLVTADLGRHIANGKWLLENGIFGSDVLSTNYYSYTYPSFPFVNHHWGTGVLFYWIHQFFGFEGLSIFYAGLTLATFGFFSALGICLGGEVIGLLASFACIPLIAARAEIRPEVFSYFFSGVFTWILFRAPSKAGKRSLLALPALMLLWANLHIYFIFGFVIIGVFFLEAVAKRQIEYAKTLVTLGFFSVLASLCNPIGYELLLMPFTIFKNYGYMIVENQSVIFYLKRGIFMPAFAAFFVVSILALIGIAWGQRIRKFNWREHLALLLLGVLFLVMGSQAIRNFTLVGFFGIPVLSWIFSFAKGNSRWIALLCIAGVASEVAFLKPMISDSNFGIGLVPHMNDSAKFFKANHLEGPIFNNYDIGSYLIFHLFPGERVFVDNRPEAYPAAFLSDTYVPMQEDSAKWKALNRFNVIYFYWHDFTPWAQTFLKDRLADPDWAPVYVDDFALILLRRIPRSQAVISRHEISKDHFRFNSQ